MALIQQMFYTDPEEASFSNEDVFMVTDAVGEIARNWWTDIQLVQYLIGSIYIYANEDAGDWKQKMTSGELKNLPDPNKDFKRLKKTADLIRRFQQDCHKESQKVLIDGRIDRARMAISSKSNTPYTILIANDYFGSAVQASQGVDDWQKWALNDDPDMPKLLKAELQTRYEKAWS
jgi:hypothetical protein